MDVRSSTDRVPLCHESLNGSCPKSTYPAAFRVPLYVFFGSSVVLTVVGNLLVIVTVVHFKQLHTPTNYLILSLAVSDLLLGGFVMPPSMVRSVESCWYFGEWFCKVHTGTDVMCCTASILNLSLISIDRYYAIGYPLQYSVKVTGRAAIVMICISWGISAVVGFGMVFLELNIVGIDEEFYNSVACTGGCVLLQSVASSTVSSLLSFYIPGLIMLCIYLKIYLIAQQQARSIHSKHVQGKPSAAAAAAAAVSKMERKATKTLAIIMGVFLSFWLPFFLCNIIDPLSGYSIPPLWFDMVVWIGYFNSTCNPVVYALFYSWFRKAFRIILLGKVFQNDSSKLNLFTE